MSNFSQRTYEQMYDALLSQELCYCSYAATEANIRNAMKKVLGATIKQRVIKKYSNLVLSEDLNVYFTIVDADGTTFELKLLYGQ